MKNKLYLFFAIILLNAPCLSAQIPYGDFSTWMPDSAGSMSPVGWQSTNSSFDMPTVYQDTDRLGGPGYSVRLTTVYDSSAGYYQGGQLDQTNVPFTGSVRPMNITGYWKFYDPMVGSGMFVDVIFYNAAHAQIGEGTAQVPFTGTFLNWTLFSWPIDYTTNDAIASYTISAFISNFAGDPSIYGVIDDLSFDNNTSVTELQKNNLPYTLQEITNGYAVGIHLDKSQSVTAELYDISGKKIKTIYNGTAFAGDNNYTIDLSNVNSGIYFCRIMSMGKSVTVKLRK